MSSKDNLIGSKIKAVPKDQRNIGVDTDQTLVNELLAAAMSSSVNLSVLDNFNVVAQTREQIYQLIDSMSSDGTISAILETYAEDVCESNDSGVIVWCDSSDSNVAQYVTFLLDSMNVDKHIYGWVYNLVKYGDIYLRLFRESDYGSDILFNTNKKEVLNEDVIVKLYKDKDHYVNYVEAVKNPGEMFELTRFGKTMGYIKAPVNIQHIYDGKREISSINSYNQYKMRKNDVTIYQATDFVHGILEDTSSRTAEEIDIYVDEKEYEDEINANTYNVRRGQSLLYNLFKEWRQWKLLENSMIVNQSTKSSIIRLLQIEVGDMPKDKVRDTLQQLKHMVEQKMALNVNSNVSEYTNPGAIENTIYIPTKGEVGKISSETLGSNDTEPKNLLLLEYLRDLFFSGTRIPKQFFGWVGDDAGFSGGTSLTLISSRYGKAIKRIQNSILQALTDAINLMLIDRGLNNYVNKFTLRMQQPPTQEMKDRTESKQNEIGVIRDLMGIVGEQVEDQSIRLELLKELLSTSTQNPYIISLIQEQIDLLEASEDNEKDNEQYEEDIPENNFNIDKDDTGEKSSEDLPRPSDVSDEISFGESLDLHEEEEYLPSFNELEIEDGSDMTLFE